MNFSEIQNILAYHPADTPERVEAHKHVRAGATAMASVLADLPESREKSLAVTALQEMSMWANAAVAIHLPSGDGVPRSN